MKYVVPLTLALTFAVVPLTRADDKKDTDPLADKVRKAIDSGTKFLRDNQTKAGDFERDVLIGGGRYGGAQTALALLALLNAGVPVDDPNIKNGLDSLRKVEPTTTYVVALQTMTFAQAGKNEDKERIQKNVKWLLDTRQKKGWAYTREESKAGKTPDNSNTQYALLGLSEGRRAGATIDADTMKEIQQMYLDQQSKESGAWSYSTEFAGGRFTMTTAGVCGLLITGMNQDQEHKDLTADGVDKHCGEYKDNVPVKKGLDWLAARFPNRMEPGRLVSQGLIPPFYCLYGLERCGRLSGQRFLGDKDWYRIGCQYLVEVQNADGSWKGGVLSGDVPGEVSQMVSTCFALLFLSKGRTPVLWTKLAWGDSEELGWNRKHNDARNVTDFASRELFKNQPMAWQVFDVRKIEANTKDSRLKLSEELLQSPIVFLSGHYLKLDEKQKDVLREYMANGGFLFAEACCNSQPFDRDFRALMKELYPDSTLDELPEGHALWTARYPLVKNTPFKLLGIQQGCKTVVVYCPQALSGYWEANLYADKERGTKAFQLAGNVIAYATGLEPPKPKGYEVPITRDSKRDAGDRNYLKVAQLRYRPEHGQEWQPAPKAMRNLMEECHKVGIDVVPDTRAIDPSDKNLVDYPFLYMHGRTGFKIPEDLESLKFNLEKKRGLLLADACCGSKEFDASFRKLMTAMFPKNALEPLSPSDELYSKELNGVAINEVRCRRLGPDDKPQAELHKVAPALEGIKIEGRWVVIYSKYDIGCALENSKASDCLGHDHDSAVLLARAAVLYALKR